MRKFKIDLREVKEAGLSKNEDKGRDSGQIALWPLPQQAICESYRRIASFMVIGIVNNSASAMTAALLADGLQVEEFGDFVDSDGTGARAQTN